MEKMNLKRPKKRRKKFKYIFCLLIIYLIFLYTFYYSMSKSNVITNENFIKVLLKEGNLDNYKKDNFINILNNTINIILKVDISMPKSLLNNGILKNNAKKDNHITLEHNDDYSNMEELKKISAYISDPNHVDIDNPIIYIYNSHQLENYSNKNLEIYGITPNVLMASYILKERLNDKGLSTIVEDANLSEFLELNGWNYASSYKASRLLILDKKSSYPSIKYFIDIHRDSVNKESSTTTIDNKKYAKVLFVVGLDNTNYKNNLTKIEKINNLIEKKYPGLSRGILKKSGKGVDGVYNQDINENCMLIEIGGLENTIEEVYNTIDALVNILSIYIKGE